SNFLSYVATLDSDVFDLLSDDVQQSLDQFYAQSLSLLDKCYAQRVITLTSCEPSYVNPSIKADLRLKNKLMRARKISEANALSMRIGKSIIKHNVAEFKETDCRLNAKDLWE